MISFNAIPINMLTPGFHVEVDNSKAVKGPVVAPLKVLVLGQRLAAGTVPAGAITRITSDAQADVYFGKGSMLAAMLKSFRSANPYTDVRALAQDDPASGVAAVGNITLGGTITAAGTLCLYIAGQAVRCAIAAGDSGAAATALAAAINADASLPVSASVSASVVSLTSRHKGQLGNQLDLQFNYYTGEAFPAGLTATISAMANGSGNPDLTTVLAAVGDEQYATIVSPYTDAANLSALEAELLRRFGPMVQREGLAFMCYPGTHATIATLGGSRNSYLTTIMGAQGSPTAPWCIAAITAAADALETDPARPRQGLTLAGMLPPKEALRYTNAERNLHLHSGISTFVIDDAGNCVIERLITTYKTNAFGATDTSFLNIETMRTVCYMRYSVRNRMALKFPRYKLASDGTPVAPGSAVVTPTIIRAELVSLFQDWLEMGIAEDMEQFKRDLVVERNSTDPDRVDAIIPPNTINQFRIFAAKLQFIL